MLTTTRISTFRGRQMLTAATAFFFRRDGRLYAVTSRHVLHDEPSGHFPDRVELVLHVDAVDLTRTVLFSVLLYEEGRAVWRQGNDSGSGLAIAVGALLDGIPESIVIGLSLLAGGAVSFVAVTAIFLSNIPEGLSSSAGMKKAGRSATYVFGVWAAIAVASGVAAWAGYSVFRAFPPEVVAGTTAVAAGAILSMLADTMIPEAFEASHDAAGLITVAGFLASFALSKLGG